MIQAPQDLQILLSQKQTEVDNLREKVEELYPDLKDTQQLADKTKVDALFYLRYVLSSKDDLSTKAAVTESKTLKNICQAIEFRSKPVQELNECNSSACVKAVPILRTGELSNGFPVLYLPVEKIDFDKIISNKDFKATLKNHLIEEKNQLFNELDDKTRETGNLYKSVTIYDLKGMSFNQIFKLKGFFKLIQSQKKDFKSLFPQLTEQTFFVNVSASYLVKNFITSSKQKIISIKDLVSKYQISKNILPDFIGGNFRWPQTANQLQDIHYNRSTVSTDMNSPMELDISSVNIFDSYEGANEGVKSKSGREISMKVVEREMVVLKKHRLFSINVMLPDQKTDLYFNNFKNKQANVLIITKQKNMISKHAVKLPKGFSSTPIHMETAGQIFVVYLDSSKAKKYSKKVDISLEKVSGKRGLHRKAFRNGRKKIKKAIQKKKVIDVDTVDYLRRQQAIGKGLKADNQVLFRFEVSDTITCGSETVISDGEIEQLMENVSTVEEEELVDFEGLSLTSRDSICSKTEPSFFMAAAQILTGGSSFW